MIINISWLSDAALQLHLRHIITILKLTTPSSLTSHAGSYNTLKHTIIKHFNFSLHTKLPTGNMDSRVVRQRNQNYPGEDL